MDVMKPIKFLNIEKLEDRCLLSRDLLYVRVKFSDQANFPEDYSTSVNICRIATNNIKDYSGGRESFTYNIREVRLPYSSSSGGDYSKISRDVNNILSPNNNLRNYEHISYRFSSNSFRYAGLGEVGGTRTWIDSNDPIVLTHELGHNLGLSHSNSSNPDNNAFPLGNARVYEYGDLWSSMGNGRGDWNASQKSVLGYISGNQIRTVSRNATISLSSHDDALRYNPNEVYLIKVPLGQTSIYASYRRDARGVTIHVDSSYRPSGGTLIDGNPQTEIGTDSALRAGQSITKYNNPGISDDIKITVQSIVGNRANIVVSFGSSTSAMMAAFASLDEANKPIDRCRPRTSYFKALGTV